jgi:hypothetical protein
MLKLKLIKVQGKIYSQLGLYGGRIYLGNPQGIKNNVIRKGVIWEMQPFQREIPIRFYIYYNICQLIHSLN